MFFEANFWLGGSRKWVEKGQIIIFIFNFLYFSTSVLQSWENMELKTAELSYF